MTDPTNAERAAFGREAVLATGRDLAGDPATDALDALADILHFVRSLGEEPGDLVRRALDHFEAEKAEEEVAPEDRLKEYLVMRAVRETSGHRTYVMARSAEEAIEIAKDDPALDWTTRWTETDEIVDGSYEAEEVGP